VRLDFANARRVEQLQPAKSVHRSAFEQIPQPLHLLRQPRHHELAADLVPHSGAGAELRDLPDAADRQQSLLRPRAVGQPAMQDAAVVARLVAPDAVFLF
jgi:hypothetical protein